MLLRRFYLLENEKSPTTIGKKQRKLEENEFPKLNYSEYLSVDEFVDMFGYEFEHVYNNNDFLEFDQEGNLLNEHPTGDSKRPKKTQ
ncbi:unnamed protein product [Ambrosiozyma monospora]|uniref:Unnamed protein product n=1 Tax=Ambrosiozyma monospora TaxID=43982 RepID=A0ACB5SUL8_AMBMO|nr:unnamed protein product [Ambrosiozyma monospora]